MLFTVIPLLWLVSGQVWEAHFDAIYCHPAPLADSPDKLGKHILTLFAVIPLLWLISEPAWVLALALKVDKMSSRSLDLSTFWPWLQKSTK